MAKRIQLRRGTTSSHSTFTGVAGEITVDTSKYTAVVHDGSTAGGIPLLRQDASNLTDNTVAVTKLNPASGNYGDTLMINQSANAWEVRSVGPISCQVFSSSGTWTRPANITKIRVQVQGAGGGGGGHGESGGGGGYSEKIIDVRSISSVTVTVGTGGSATTYNAGVAGTGGTSSFGAYCSATGGYGTYAQGQHCGGAPGIGSGGNLNIYGGGGSGHSGHGSDAAGGSSYFGGCSPGRHSSYGGHTPDYESHASPGAGGMGAWTSHTRGGYGKDGIIIVWEYA